MNNHITIGYSRQPNIYTNKNEKNPRSKKTHNKGSLTNKTNTKRGSSSNKSTNLSKRRDRDLNNYYYTDIVNKRYDNLSEIGQRGLTSNNINNQDDLSKDETLDSESYATGISSNEMIRRFRQAKLDHEEQYGEALIRRPVGKRY